MNIKNLFSDDRAVSPVIGVILMVAITVILAAVIGTFVLGLGDQLGDNAPSASYSWDQDTDDDGDIYVDLEHRSGENIRSDTVTATIEGVSLETASGDDDFGDEWAANERIRAGDTIRMANDTDLTNVNNADVSPVDATEDVFEEGNTIRVTWEAPGGGSSSTLTSYEIN